MAAKSVNELVDPAVHGTVGVLKSAHKNGKDVKRVVMYVRMSLSFKI